MTYCNTLQRPRLFAKPKTKKIIKTSCPGQKVDSNKFYNLCVIQQKILRNVHERL